MKTARTFLLIVGLGVAACTTQPPRAGESATASDATQAGESPRSAAPLPSGDCYRFERTVDEIGTVYRGIACREADGTWRVQPPR